MKKFVLLFPILIGVLTQGKCTICDTIDVYWVYYNDSVLAKMNQNMEGQGYLIRIKKAIIKMGDSISIRYGNDTRSSRSIITIKDSNQNLIKVSTEKGDWVPVSFSAFELLQIANKTHNRDCMFYRNNGGLLFKLHLE